MCGIFGLYIKKNVSNLPLSNISDDLFRLSESRGKEAAGAFIKSKSKNIIFRSNFRATKLVKEKSFIESSRILFNDNSQGDFLIGHSRLVTNGDEKDNRNNQPVSTNGIIGIHNGIITNDKDIWRQLPEHESSSQLDSEALFTLLDCLIEEKHDYDSVFDATFKRIKGSASIAFLDKKNNNLVLSTNTGSLYIAESDSLIIFASEAFILHRLIKKHKLLCGGVKKLRPLSYVKYETPSLNTNGLHTESEDVEMISLVHTSVKKLSTIPDVSSFIAPSIFNNEYQNRKRSILGLKRCTKCILPETMPFISFNDEGVCSYCRSHTPIQTKGDSALMQLADSIRSGDGSIDCVVALSGGRDSTYGLHYVKNVLKLNPVAYTYDWGMVTDEARKTSANICGKLGVEHIIVSADISKKRENIGKNVEAWLKNPKLGMIPLFMAGDKQFYYHAEKVKQQTGAKAVFFSAGNELERTDFKNGFCGVESGGLNGLLATIPLNSKLSLVSYFMKNFLTNPSYFNSSLFDTAHAFFSTYMMKHNFSYIYHYHKWEESKIMSVLRNEYDWVDASDTSASWRIGDGTAAFYNYIYYMTAGFTENDTFRSNQIREGIISREEALKLVDMENEPRFATIKAYTEMIGVDFYQAIETINKIKVLW